MEHTLVGDLTLQAAGRPFKGYLSGQGPGVLVLHAWWGLTPFFKQLCDRLAGEGFCAFAPDLQQGKTARTVAQAEAIMARRDYERTRAVVTASADFLQRHPLSAGGPLAVVGFSMGASWAVTLASLAPGQVEAAVLFYGVEGADFSTIRAAFQGHYGEQDTLARVDWSEQMEADMRAAGLQVTFYRYSGAGHWFFESDHPEYYNESAAALAWERTLSFLRVPERERQA